jgi:hypothetical protein
MRLEKGRKWLSVAALAASVLLLAVYGPVVSWGPLAEDLQWALAGWSALHHPQAFLGTFHQHYRPWTLGFFAAGTAAFGDWWLGYRLLALACLAGLGFALGLWVLRQGKVPAVLVPTFLATWLASPLADEVLFVTCEVQQVLYSLGVVLALLSRSPERVGTLFWLGFALALGSKEEAVTLLPLVVAQDGMLFRLPPKRLLGRALPVAAVLGAYLVAYRLAFGVQASWFYAAAWQAPLNFATTWPAFWHFHGPVVGWYGRALPTTWPWFVLSLLATGLLVAATWKVDRFPAFSLAAACLALVPTLPAFFQTPRYTFLPYAFFLAGVVRGALLLEQRLGRWWLAPALVACWGAVLANDATLARADLRDWDTFRRLTEALNGELGPVLAALEARKVTLVERGVDGGPLGELVRRPSGIPKVYFPRPDDPYGVVSVSAVASWRLRHQGLVAVRCHGEGCPAPQAAFRHEVGGFVAVSPAPVPPRELFGARKVLLVPRPAEGFFPEAFP